MESSPLLSRTKKKQTGGTASVSSSGTTMPPPVSGGVADRYLVGVGLLLGVVILWTTSNFITAALETGEESWSKPFLITYLNTSSFTLYLIPTIWKWRRGELIAQQRGREYHPIPDSPHAPLATGRPSSLLAADNDNSHRRSTSLTRTPVPSSPRAALHSLDPPPPFTFLNPDLEEQEINLAGVQPPADKLTIRETAVVAAWWSALWFIANWAVNASLAWTSVASVTILSCTSGFFTLALGRVFGVETLTRTKVIAVLASFCGVVLVTRSDSNVSTASVAPDNNLPSNPILGDFAALLSASLYAVYVVFLKVRVGDESRADMQLMLGFAGLFNTTCLLPLFPILHMTGLERFEWPPTRAAWAIIFANMVITVSSDYLYVLAMLKTTPMLVTIGLSLTIPLALIVSMVLPGGVENTITLMSLAGAGLVVVGFGMLGYQGWEESRAAPLESATPEDEPRGS